MNRPTNVHMYTYVAEIMDFEVRKQLENKSCAGD